MDAVFRDHPGWKVLSRVKLVLALKKEGITVSKADLDRYFESHPLHQVYSKPKKPQKQDQFRITCIPHSYQIDVVVMGGLARQNHGKDRFLLAVDIMSRKAFAYTLGSNKMSDVLGKYKRFLEGEQRRGEPLYHVMGDDFFSAKEFVEFNKQKGVEVRTCVAKQEHLTRTGNKLGIVDRLTRTLKSYLDKHMTETGTSRWVDAVDQVVETYNSTSHASLNNKTPSEAHGDLGFLIRLHREHKNHNTALRHKLADKFKTGQTVRVLEGKGVFDKEKARFSREVYTVEKMDANRYVVAGEDGKELDRRVAGVEMMSVVVREKRLAVRKLVKKTNQVSNMLVTKERLVRTRTKATKVMVKAMSAKPISSAVVERRKAQAVAKRVEKMTKSKVVTRKWFEVNPDEINVGPKMRLRDRNTLKPPSWWLGKNGTK